MAEKDNIKFIRRCLELASKAEGLTYPNPMVGCVIVHNNIIVGEGFHLKAGGPHAEVIAINSVYNREILKDSILYVNLEPCSHFGKTPPCADYIISSGIPRVVIGSTDTSDKVSGNGILKLRNAGCEVIVGVAVEECRRLNRRFFTYNEKRRPYITLKWAQSADGFLDIIRTENHKSEPNWITGKPERILVHKWRACEQAILVGAGTVKADNPKLNVREWRGNDPIKIILSGSGVINYNSALFETNSTVVVFTHEVDVNIANGIKVKLDDTVTPSSQIAGYLFNSGIQSLLIEGGSKVLNHFIETGFWDEARVFTGDQIFNNGIKAPLLSSNPVSETDFSGSILLNYLKERSVEYFDD